MPDIRTGVLDLCIVPSIMDIHAMSIYILVAFRLFQIRRYYIHPFILYKHSQAPALLWTSTIVSPSNFAHSGPSSTVAFLTSIICTSPGQSTQSSWNCVVWLLQLPLCPKSGWKKSYRYRCTSRHDWLMWQPAQQGC